MPLNREDTMLQTRLSAVPLEPTSRRPENFVSLVEAAFAQSKRVGQPVSMSYDEIALVITAKDMDGDEALRSAKEAYILSEIRCWLGLTTSGVVVEKTQMHEHFNALQGTDADMADQLLAKAKSSGKFATAEINGALVIAAPTDDKASMRHYLRAIENEHNAHWRRKASDWPMLARAIRL